MIIAQVIDLKDNSSYFGDYVSFEFCEITYGYLSHKYIATFDPNSGSGSRIEYEVLKREVNKIGEINV